MDYRIILLIWFLPPLQSMDFFILPWIFFSTLQLEYFLFVDEVMGGKIRFYHHEVYSFYTWEPPGLTLLHVATYSLDEKGGACMAGRFCALLIMEESKLTLVIGITCFKLFWNKILKIFHWLLMKWKGFWFCLNWEVFKKTDCATL